MVKRALDAGAHGIIVPLLYTVEDAKKLVEASKFPPRGKRGFGSPFSMGAFDVKGNLTGYEYMTSANDNLVTIVQIETREAFESVSSEDLAISMELTLTRLRKSQRLMALMSYSLVHGIWVTIWDIQSLETLRQSSKKRLLAY